jgi:membrane-associated phospholipid phosphatase
MFESTRIILLPLWVIQRCWDDPERLGSYTVVLLAAISNSIVYFCFSAVAHMIWWGWCFKPKRQREAAAYAFAVTVVFNWCMLLKYVLPYDRPHLECFDTGLVLSLDASRPSVHVVMAAFMGLFYAQATWRAIGGGGGDDTAACSELLNSSESGTNEEKEDDPFVKGIEGGGGGGGKEEDDNSITQRAMHAIVTMHDERESPDIIVIDNAANMGRLEGYARILCILAYVFAVSVARIQLETNHVSDVMHSVLWASVAYVIFLYTCNRLWREPLKEHKKE